MLSRPEQTKPQPAALPGEQWISAKQVGAEFGVDADTVLRWWKKGLPTGLKIPRQFHRRRGSRRHIFHPQIIALIREQQEVSVEPNKSQNAEQWLTPKMLAARFGLKPDSAYRWIAAATIPAELVRRSGNYFIRIHPAAVKLLEKTFESAHRTVAGGTAVNS
jgi:hypothetical protein